MPCVREVAVVCLALVMAACGGGKAPRPGTAGGSGGEGGVGGGGGGAPPAGGAGGTSSDASAIGGSGGMAAQPDGAIGRDSSPDRGSAPDYPPGGKGESYAATMLSPGAGVRTDRRPVSIGFHDPGVKKTFISWMGVGSNAIVKELDHATGMWSADKIVGRATFDDKHNYPAMIRGADDRLYLFYGCHNTPLRMARSPNPLSIEGTWSDGNVAAAPGASYPAPVVARDGTIYVFHRWTRQSNGHTDDRPYAFVKSTNNGGAWTKQMIVDPYPRSDNLTEIYNGKVTYQPDGPATKAKIHIAWTLAGGGPGTHAHATYGRNVYYAYLDPTNDHMFDVTGRDLGTTIDNTEAEMYCKPLDTGCSNCGHQASLQVSVHALDDGTPLILFGHLTNGLSSLRWSGSAWVSRVVTSEKGEPRELSKFGPRSFKAFRTAGNGCQVFRTTDGGDSWTPETTIMAPHPVGRCHVVDNHHPDAKVFMEENPEGNGGDTSFAKVVSSYDPPYEFP
jgi:BNR repeat-containing family member